MSVLLSEIAQGLMVASRLEGAPVGTCCISQTRVLKVVVIGQLLTDLNVPLSKYTNAGLQQQSSTAGFECSRLDVSVDKCLSNRAKQLPSEDSDGALDHHFFPVCRREYTIKGILFIIP